MSLKLLPAALLLFVALAAGFGQSSKSAEGTVTGAIVASTGEVVSGGIVEITIPVGGPETTEATQVQVTGQSADIGGGLSGTLVVLECSPSCPEELGESGTTVSVDTDNLTEIVVGLQLLCNEEWTALVTAEPGEDDQQSIDITCTPTGSGGGSDGDHSVDSSGVYQVVLTAAPNILPCEGGTTELTAEIIDAFGDVVPGVEFRFFTTAGTLEQTSPDTADLTLGPNQTSAVVTATIPDATNLEEIHIDEAVTTVNLECNGDAANQTLVVTASPNKVDCSGTTTLTASVRDRNGHVVPGRGFHFVTTAGLLEVAPDNANTEEGIATLTLGPGDGDAQVTVSSGLLHGTYEDHVSVDTHYIDDTPDFPTDEIGFVTVQQDCFGNTTGQIKVNASAKNLTCGENVFIGLSVIDEDIQTVANGTPMTLIATAGGFYGGEGTVLSAAQVPTTNGEANTIYTAPANFNGEVKITAASGDAYGYEILNVTCIVSPATGIGTAAGAGTSNATAPSCTPIGDGVCVQNAIRPPNTGGGGLK